jgi:hypothetical protein
MYIHCVFRGALCFLIKHFLLIKKKVLTSHSGILESGCSGFEKKEENLKFLFGVWFDYLDWCGYIMADVSRVLVFVVALVVDVLVERVRVKWWVLFFRFLFFNGVVYCWVGWFPVGFLWF